MADCCVLLAAHDTAARVAAFDERLVRVAEELGLVAPRARGPRRSDRAAWLHQRSGTYVSDGPWRGEVIDLAQPRNRHWPGDSPTWTATSFVGHDALQFEAGAFAALPAERGPLLPDERLPGQMSLLVERSPYKIEDVTCGSFPRP